MLTNKLYLYVYRGVVMVGPGAVVNVQYFKDLGGFDTGMKIWGGENLEFPWKVCNKDFQLGGRKTI